ncbi:MAG: hypothetical protein VW079_00720, partial [Candidatus Woesearchaeota archaeon]
MTPVQIRPELLLMNIKNNNMKKILFLLFIFPIVFSLTEEVELLNENDSVLLDGRNISVKNIFEEAILVSVDYSDNKILRINETLKLQEVNLTIEDIVYTPDERYVSL